MGLAPGSGSINPTERKSDLDARRSNRSQLRMPYITDRVAHDADAHIMEPPNWLRDHADPDVRERLERPSYANELAQTGDGDHGGDQERIDDAFTRLAERHRSDEFLTDEAVEVMNRKNFAATGSFLAEDRSRALDYIGVSSQLLFNTFHNSRLYQWEHQPDLDLAYGAARAHNRGMVEFCSIDERLLPTCYVPLADFERAAAITTEAIEMGAAALLVASGCPAGRSPSHVALDTVWRQAEEAGLPIVFHVGGTGDLIDKAYFDNGLPVPPDFHGGEENFRSVDYMAIPFPPMQTLATLIFDGVLDRFPQLRFGVIEQGCIWLPSWLKQMESAMDAFGRHEERLRRLSLRPDEFVQRQVRVTPYPTEDVGWVTEQVGPDILLFNTDYPHVEGGRRPFERFERSLGDAGEDVRRKFYADNFVDLMGAGLPASLVS